MIFLISRHHLDIDTYQCDIAIYWLFQFCGDDRWVGVVSSIHCFSSIQCFLFKKSLTTHAYALTRIRILFALESPNRSAFDLVGIQYATEIKNKHILQICFNMLIIFRRMS